MLLCFLSNLFYTRKRRLVNIETDMSVADSFGSTSDEHDLLVLLGANHDKAHQAPSLNAGLSSASMICRADVPSERDVYIGKYIA
jgi:hypothetical protein